MEGLRDPVVIGVVGAPHGVGGTVRVRPTGSGRHLRDGAKPFVGGERRRISNSRWTPKGILVDFEGVVSREEAAKLRGEELVLDRDELDAPEEDEFYVDDLPGLVAVNESGETIGEVTETFETQAHEVLVIGAEDGEIYVPFTIEHVPEVDLESSRVVVVPPEAEDQAR